MGEVVTQEAYNNNKLLRELVKIVICISRKSKCVVDTCIMWFIHVLQKFAHFYMCHRH